MGTSGGQQYPEMRRTFTNRVIIGEDEAAQALGIQRPNFSVFVSLSLPLPGYETNVSTEKEGQ
jgi:hypothetical protein